jgi:hypothetical protein
MGSEKRATNNPDQEAYRLYMVEKYERVIEYLYPIIQSIPRKHGSFRELMIRQLFLVADHLNDAIKANQLSRCYTLDGSLGQLRLMLRFMVSYKRKMLTEHQLETVQAMIGEVGSMLGAWIKRLRQIKNPARQPAGA